MSGKTLAEVAAKHEREANAFAMELLMPTEMVHIEVKKLAPFDIHDEKKIRILADKFKVDKYVMAIRLGQLFDL